MNCRDNYIYCEKCQMVYYIDVHVHCPYCAVNLPKMTRIEDLEIEKEEEDE